MNDHDNLCPECNGHGWYVTPHIWYPEEDDWVEVYCFACDGTGTLAAIPTEEEAAQPERWESDEYERWLDGI